MSDDDKVNAKLAWCYQKPYQQLCEGRLEPCVVALQITKGLIHDLNKFGDHALGLLRSVAGLLPGPLVARVTDWDQLRERINDLSHQSSGPGRGVHLAQTVCLAAAAELESAHAIEGDFAQALTERYMEQFLQRRFIERIPQQKHHVGADPQTLEHRLGDTMPLVRETLKKWAGSAARSGSFKKLRQPSMKTVESEIDLNEDLR